MKLLEKLNPKATRQSLIEEARGGAIAGLFIGVQMACRDGIVFSWKLLWMPPLYAVIGGFMFGTIHWQIPQVDDDKPQVLTRWEIMRTIVGSLVGITLIVVGTCGIILRR